MTDGSEVWQRLGDEFAASDPSISRSAMMGFPSLRFEGAFFASLDHGSDDLVVKLAAVDVAARIHAGSGKPFAPAGKVFREWLAIEPGDEHAWRGAMADALAFVRSA
jgi:hypothetical protein